MNPHAGAVDFNASRYGESSLKIAPAQPLAPGEYALKAPGGPGEGLMGQGQSAIFYCFDVDASTSSVVRQEQ